MSIKSMILRSTFWMKDFFNGSPIRNQYIEVKKSFEGEKVDKKEELKRLLSYAVENCSFYHSASVSDLNKFPVVNKSILIQQHDNILVPESINPYQEKGKKYHIQKTSGSTGTPFAMPFDTRKRLRRIAELKYFGEIVGFKSHEKLIQLRIWTHWQSKSNKQAFWENIVPFNIANPNKTNLKILSELINKEKAICLRSYASAYDLLANYASESKEQYPSLKVLIAGSEMLLDSTRELVKKYIGCPIVSQYANEENGILAQELLNDVEHRFYMNDGSYIFEVLKLDSDKPAAYGEIGRIVITDLFNYAFPVIRYDNGDTCCLEYDEVKKKPYISKLFGRRIDLLYDTKGEAVFPMVLARVLKNYDSIVQWQFIQKTKVDYVLKINKKGNIPEDDILNVLKESFGTDANIGFEYVDDIPVLKSGKRKSVINEMNEL